MIFFFYSAALFFFLSVMVGLIKGHSLTIILLRSLGIYCWIIFLGVLTTKVFGYMRIGLEEKSDEEKKGQEVDVIAMDGEKPSSLPQEDDLAVLKKQIAQDPKKIADAIKGIVR
jgi:hypothetical protein